MGGFEAARGRFVIMGDADASYDFSAIAPFVERLRAGDDLVMGNRFKGGIGEGAMPFLNRYVGNPVLSFIGRLFFPSAIGDFHCGLRGFSKEAALALGLQATGMEFASEMVVKATLWGQKITEVPTTLKKDGRSRPPHLRSWRDGWRHLRFLLLYSPRWLFLYPGAVLALVGLVASAVLLPTPRVHTLVYAAMLVVIGFQTIVFAAFTKIFAINEGLLPPDRRLDRVFRVVTLEVGLALGVVMVAAGIAGSLYALAVWEQTAFGALDASSLAMRIVIVSSSAIALGVQVILSSFFFSILGLRRRL
jgi:hypothetical protein